MLHRRPALLCTAAAIVALLATTASAQAGASRTNTTGAASATSSNTTTSTDNTTSELTLSRVDQNTPPFSGLRSCLPFNILLAAAAEGQAAQPTPSANGTNVPISGSSNNYSGRIIIEADYNVINSTLAAVEDGILTLSLAGGFESQQPINFTVTMPAATQLRYVANYGAGLVVLGPGHNTSNLRIVAPTVGQVQAINLTATQLSFTANGVVGSSLSGAFERADITTNVGTGSVALTSITPVNLTVNLNGITTVVADIPTGSSITGTAGGLSKVQYTNGTCSVSSQFPLAFPAPSIFGRSGFGFGAGSVGNMFGGGNSKCQHVAPEQLAPVVQVAENPQWTCGVIVDGQLSCQGNGTKENITWSITNLTAYQPTPNPAVNTIGGNTSTGQQPAGTNAATNTPTDTTGSPSGTGSGSVDVIGSAAGGNNAGTTESIPGSVNTIGTAAGAANAPGEPSTFGGGGQGGNAGQTATTAVEPNTGTSGTAGTGARKLLQGEQQAGANTSGATTTEAGAGPFSSLFTGGGLNPVTTTTPTGTLTTGSYTSGPGSFASGSSSTGGTTQTTSSQGGSSPQTLLSTGGVGSSISNPMVVPSTPPQTFASDNVSSPSPSPASPTATSPTPEGPATAAAAAPGAAQQPASVQIRTTGPGAGAGLAVVSTVCSSRQQSLSMLVQPELQQSTSANNVTAATASSATAPPASPPAAANTTGP